MQPVSTPPDALFPGITLEQHLMRRQRRFPDATGDFTGLFQQLTLATKMIASRVRRAGLFNQLGKTGQVNVQGECVEKLDDIAHHTIVQSIENGHYVGVAASEEAAEPMVFDCAPGRGRYALVFDPLDGSSNLDVSGSTGTIFAIYRRAFPLEAPKAEDVLQPGQQLAASGYVIYGSSTILVYSTGEGLYGFTYDPSVGEFFLSHPDIRIPDEGRIYSVNEANSQRWHRNFRRWVKQRKLLEQPWSLRYSGAMVADVHRILLKGGLFAYPAEKQLPRGKLRLLCEAAPFAFLVRAAGGDASDGQTSILDIVPRSLHQRTPVFMGSRRAVAEVVQALGQQECEAVGDSVAP